MSSSTFDADRIDLLARCIMISLESIILAYFLYLSLMFLKTYHSERPIPTTTRSPQSQRFGRSTFHKATKYKAPQRDIYTFVMLVLIAVQLLSKVCLRLPFDVYFLFSNDEGGAFFHLADYQNSLINKVSSFLNLTSIRVALMLNVARWAILNTTLTGGCKVRTKIWNIKVILAIFIILQVVLSIGYVFFTGVFKEAGRYWTHFIVNILSIIAYPLLYRSISRHYNLLLLNLLPNTPQTHQI